MKIAWIAFLLAASAGPALGGPNLVVSKEAPALTLRIDPRVQGAEAAQASRSRMLTNAERRIFVEAGRDRMVERMVIVQFEKVRPGSDFRFRLSRRRRRASSAPRPTASGPSPMTMRTAAKAASRARSRARLAPGSRPPATPRRASTASPRLARVTDPKGLSRSDHLLPRECRRPPAGGQARRGRRLGDRGRGEGGADDADGGGGAGG